jgi:deoxyribose-phosphate aldolase
MPLLERDLKISTLSIFAHLIMSLRLDNYPVTDFGWQEKIEPFAFSIPEDAKKSYPHSHPALSSAAALNRTIEHTLVSQDATPEQFEQLYAEARSHNFATVCIRPPHVAEAVQALHGTDVGVASVIGFHEGTIPLSTKISEAKKHAITAHVTELDIVLDREKLIAGE